MTEMTAATWAELAREAQTGNREALEALIRSCQDQIYALALRFLANPEDARDATQDILIILITRLSTFEGRSAFRTWAFRIAVNHLLRSRKLRARSHALSFAAFEEDLHSGLRGAPEASAEDKVLSGELRIACTMAMLLCLDMEHRMAFVLGEIIELDHREAAEALDISPANYRKRLSRARADIVAFTGRICGNVNASARCHCPRRVPEALRLGRVSPAAPLSEANRDESFDALLDRTRHMERDLKALCHLKHPGRFRAPDDLAALVREAVADRQPH